MSCVANSVLKPGDWVEVRSASEIMATLDPQGSLDEMPFMPEMLAHCGRRYQVYKRADKTCDTVNWTGLRKMERTVHLKMLRCDGSGHGGCQAACLLFWKEAWLRPVADDGSDVSGTNGVPAADEPSVADAPVYVELTQLGQNIDAKSGEIRYRCQATQLCEATSPLPWWEPKQYVRDVCLNDVSLGEVVRGVSIAAFSKVLRLLTKRSFPSVAGKLKKTPTESLGLQPGEWVIVKSKAEILATLDARGRNRGLSFDAEMIPFCGKRVRVMRRVERLIEEKTGRMIQPAGVGIILENVFCVARYRRSCPRAIFPYWREIWLERVAVEDVPEVSQPVADFSSTAQ
jgi:hypothetical protein